ncbi:acyltransferase family protein [Siphonobacter aquaeclarae]|uniref:Peptidoglycan/LPS O-acetylase OafA/YrhL, contains acyltransferase and SGNH-hydrolase domains n=1 Tax=Siphonobacter aquaeclarae TaxID=563176 RepID=A0A1G9L5V2_9BACT|nr:acyltransferase [Siphonobacter aquaeclarae]SDL57127.1 Peptidoglycan/LPS O-acetylase OafA/YrhL, contains acyltransferase and SGNH-hydrolase domains [Siphonobacter aquaeclarae]
MEPKKYAYIDSLRGIAILLVVLVHTGQHGAQLQFIPGRIAEFIQNGKYGVQLFFLVSAYTLMLSEKSRRGEADHLTKFLVRRIFRVAPMYYLAVLYYTIWRVNGFHFSSFDWHRFPTALTLSNLFFVHGFQPEWINSLVPGGWSIAVEMTFYCLLPLLIPRIKNLDQSIILLLISLLIMSVAKHFAPPRFPLFSYYYFPNQFPVFCLGIVAYFVTTTKESIHAPALFCLAALAFTFNYTFIPQHLIHSIAFFLLLLAVRKYPVGLLVNPALTYLGKISFSIYLLHFIVLQWMGTFGFMDFLPVTGTSSALLNFALRYAVVLGISVVIASLTYRFVEARFQQTGRNILRKMNEKALA